MALLSKLKSSATLSAIAGVVGMGSFQIWSWNCVIENKPEGMNPLLQSPLYHRLNPVANPAIYDRCTRSVDISQIKPELLEDARSGGPKLVSAFSGGLWGALGASQLRCQVLGCHKCEGKLTIWCRISGTA